MPGVIRRLLIVATVDGLVLQPHGHGHVSRPSTDEPASSSSSSSSIRIEYKTSKVTVYPPTAVLTDEKERRRDSINGSVSGRGNANGNVGIEAYGLVGMLSSFHKRQPEVTKKKACYQ